MGEGLTAEKKLEWIWAYLLRKDNDFENADIMRQNFFRYRNRDEVDHMEDIIFLSKYKEFRSIQSDLEQVLAL